MPMLKSPYLKGAKRLQAAAVGSLPVRPGEQSFRVALTQAALRDLGYSLPASTGADNVMDGAFGAETEAALKAFRSDQRLPDEVAIDGETLGAIDAMMIARFPTPRPQHKLRRHKRAPRAVQCATQRRGGGAVAATMSSVTMDDAYYKTGTDEPQRRSDVGAGEWKSRDWTYTAMAQKQAILTVLGLPTTIYPGSNATRHMRHYFKNHGLPLVIDLEGMIRNVPSAKEALVAEWRQAQRFIQTLPPGTHHFTSKAMETSYNVKEESSDWFFAIGGYSYFGKGTARINVVAGERKYEVDFVYSFFDRYNWDGEKSVTIADIEITDEFMAEFHRQGLAREYDCSGSVRRSLNWTGDVSVPADAAVIRPSGR